MALGEKLQRLRKDKGLSQEQLATQLNVSRQAVSKWEVGESVPDTENIIQLSKIFQVTTDYILIDECQASTQAPLGNEADAPITKTKKGGALLVVGLATFCMGAVGQLVIWLLSTTTLLQLPSVPQLATDPTVLSDTWVRDYANYVRHFHLDAVVAVLWGLVAVGLVLVAIGYFKRRKKT